MRYVAIIRIEILDREIGTVATTGTITIPVEEPDDPRDMLTKAALEAAIEQCDAARRWCI